MSTTEQWVGRAVVLGRPATQGSHRIGRVGGAGGRPIVIHDNARLTSWREAMRCEMMRCRPPLPLDCACWASLRITVLRPKSHFRSGKHAGELKPGMPEHPATGLDVDKVQRAAGDAGTGVWWRDDSRIACWRRAERVYGDLEQVVVECGSLER